MNNKIVKNDPRVLAFKGKGLLDIYDLQDIFDCGYSKARLVMDVLPHFRFGKKDLWVWIKWTIRCLTL